MATTPAFVSPLRFLEENPAAVLAALRQGWVDYWETAVDQVTDEHVRFALQSGLLAECAAAFPDPRLHPEIPLLVLLTASVAAAFQGEYGLRYSGCALHSPALLAELGLNAAWLAPGRGCRAGAPRTPRSSTAMCCASCSSRWRAAIGRPAGVLERACFAGGMRQWGRRCSAGRTGGSGSGSG